MYRVDRNNFYEEQKDSTVYTPAPVSEFLYRILSGRIDRRKTVVDPCVGAGSLLKPFRREGFPTVGIDIEDRDFRILGYAIFWKCGKAWSKTPLWS